MIEKNAFRGCIKLKSVAIGDNSQLTTIGDYAFYECSSLASIIIPNSVITIGIYAFSDCSSLKEVIFSEDSKLTLIDFRVFSGCSSLTTIVIPNSVTEIGDYAFFGCTALSSIIIPESVTTMGSKVFQKCTSLTIYCEALSQPSGWMYDWNYSNCPVEWGIQNLEISK